MRPAQGSAVCSARAQLDPHARKKKGRGENGHDSVGIRTGARARRARFTDGRRVELLAVGRGIGAEHSNAQGETMIVLTSFDKKLTD